MAKSEHRKTKRGTQKARAASHHQHMNAAHPAVVKAEFMRAMGKREVA